LGKGKNATYLCFTHPIEVTPVLQGGDPLSPTAPGVVHLSVPWSEDRAPLSPAEMPDVGHAFPSFLIKCDPSDFVRVLKAHTDYWRGIRYDEGNLRRDAGFGGAGSEEPLKSKSSCSC
jgi:hypothetical protein